MKVWQLQEAKARFSDVILNAIAHGSQHITLVEFMQKSPLAGMDVDLKREQEFTSDIEL